jgi:MFS family permease
MVEALLQIDALGGRTVVQFVYWLIAAFAGGAFGAAIGALPAFCFTGFAVIAGEAANAIGLSGLPEGSEIALGASGLTGLVGFGPVFGPHIAFAGGAAAAAYAAKQDGAMYEPGDGDYHLGKDIAYALGTRPDVLAVGGIFGIFGAVSNTLLGSLVATAVAFDTIAFTVFFSALLHRIVFGYSLFGSPRGDGYFDMTPFENGEKRVAADGGTGEAKRLAVEPWLPHQYKWGNVAMIGLVAGLLGGFLVISTGSMFLGFGISAASLTFLNLGVEKIPVTHHMTLPASAGASALVADPTGSSQVVAIIIAGVFGMAGGLIGEAGQRVFYAHGDTHVDPPAFAIFVCTLLIGILGVAGVTQRALFVPF